jgi:hypothetical protein
VTAKELIQTWPPFGVNLMAFESKIVDDFGDFEDINRDFDRAYPG